MYVSLIDEYIALDQYKAAKCLTNKIMINSFVNDYNYDCILDKQKYLYLVEIIILYEL